MNYTITFNPAVDLVMQMDNLQVGVLNRANREEYVTGGKGINMATILNQFGKPVIATGFLGGFSGKYIESDLNKDSIHHHFIQIDGTTRINVKIKAKQETEINGTGPQITEADFNRLVDYLEDQLQKEDVVFLAGNAAPGMTVKHYEAIGQLVFNKKANFVLDTNKDFLTACLKYQPFLIKPNQHELGEIFKTEITSLEETIYYAKQLQMEGTKNVLVSLGGDGSVLVTQEGDVYTANVPKGQVVNSVGAGDSMVAGFMAKFIETNDYALSLQYGAASGSATAFSVGIAKIEKIYSLVEQITVTQI